MRITEEKLQRLERLLDNPKELEEARAVTKCQHGVLLDNDCDKCHQDYLAGYI